MNKDFLNRIKLLIEYDTSKTLSENSLLIEQLVYQKNDKGGYNLVNGPYSGLKPKDVFPDLKPNEYPKQLDSNKNPILTTPVPSYRKDDYTPKQDYDEFKDPKSKWNKKQAADRLGVSVDRVVWDPNVTQDQQYMDRSGTHTKKVKIGGWVKMTPQNVGLRGVPFGFSPNEYPEYQKRKKELDKICKAPKSEHAKHYTNIQGECAAKYEALKNEYYHSDFPYGITKQEFLDWSKGQKDIDTQKKKEILAVKDGLKGLYRNNDFVDSTGLPKSDYFVTFHNDLVKSSESQITSGTIGQYNELSDILDALYERDPNAIKELSKTKLEKFWDEWGTVVELIAYVVIPAILTAGTSLAAQAAGLAITETAQLVRIVSVLSEYGLPLSVGAMKVAKRGKLDGESVMDFTFAFLPIIHKYIGVLKQPSLQVCESLAGKFAMSNTKTVDGMKKFISSLTQEEKYIFRQVVKNKNNLGKYIDDALKNKIKSAEIRAKLFQKAVGEIAPSIPYLAWRGVKYTLLPDLSTIEITRTLAEKYKITNDRETELQKQLDEFRKNNPEWFIASLANLSSVLEKNPNADFKQIIDNKSYERMGGDEIIGELKQLGFANFLVDLDGNPLKLN
jgi:hypothetical protein